MDENKEIFTSETGVNETEMINTENNESEEYVSAFADEFEALSDNNEQLSQENVETTLTAEPKKKRLIQAPIIIAASIVVVVALCFLVFKCFFDTSVVGTWTVVNTATSDEATKPTTGNEPKAFYTFDKDGNATVSIGSMRYVGSYSVDSNSITINIENILQSTYDFSVSGNIFTGRELVLSDPNYGQSVTLRGVSLDTPKLSVDKDFKKNDKLVGKWSYNDGYMQMSYTFNADGTAEVNQYNTLFVDGVYTADDKKITFKYVASEETSMDISYELVDDAIIIDGLKFTKDDGTTKKSTQDQILIQN